MIRQTFTMAVRVLIKNWLYTLLSILSLVLGITAFLTNLAMVERVRTMDQDLTHYDRIYHFYSYWLNLDVSRSVATTTKAADILKTRFPELEQVARMGGSQGLVVETPRFRQYEPIYLTDPNFFEIFDYTFVAGDPSTALTNPFSVILSQAAAVRYFGTEDVVGQTVTVDGEHIFEITAVIENLPETTHLTVGLGAVDVMVPLQTFENMKPDDSNTFGWGSDAALTFAIVPPTLTEAEINARLKTIVVDYWPELFHDELEIRVRPLGALVDDIVKIGDASLTDIVLILGVAVLLVACANFASLLIAQNIGRGNEVALRKAVGSSRSYIVGQFLVEGLLVGVAAVAISLAVIPMLLEVLSSTRFPLGFDVFYSTRGAAWILLLVPFVVLMGCSYPALNASSKPPNDVFRRGASSGRHMSFLRTSVVAVQFVLAIALGIGTLVAWTQQRHLMNFDLRYAKDQIIVIDRLSNPKILERLGTLKNQLNTVPGVVRLAASNQVPAENRYSNSFFYEEGSDLNEKRWLTQTFADPSFFDVYDIGLIAGRMLTRSNGNDVIEHGKTLQETPLTNVVFNEAAVDRFGWATSTEAVGKVLITGDDTRLGVVGVVENRRIRGAGTGFDPTIFIAVDDLAVKLSILMVAENMDGTVKAIETIWDSVYPEFPMQWQFLDDRFAKAYEEAQRDQFFLGFSCLFALTISCLGLFGLAGYMTEARTKEISVRKVMGATISRIVRSLLWDFSKPILLANLIAWPLVYLIMRPYLDGFAERITLSPLFFVGTGLAALLIAWLVVAAHVVRAARTHPANALRYE